jgi:2-polyprenyl-3-methyl-5-hydroxy-6-metoxy-1,4-benzoquinol methylase
MPAAVWAELNTSWHHYGENKGELADTNQPPYLQQAQCIQVLLKNGILNTTNILDYGAGYGSLSNILQKYFNLTINIYDKYVQNSMQSRNYVTQLDEKYDMVINSAMFEHVTDQKSLDLVNELVSNNGVLMIHTLVCENIPKDPNWFYMKPIVHTAFHTNKSMSILMDKWGYVESIYCPAAKSWFLFKPLPSNSFDLIKKIEEINGEMQCDYLFHKFGFVDYWKGF